MREASPTACVGFIQYQHPHVLDRKTRSRIITSDPQPRHQLRGATTEPQPQPAETDTSPMYGVPPIPTSQFDMRLPSAMYIANSPPCKEPPRCSLRRLDAPASRYRVDCAQNPLCASKMALSTANILRRSLWPCRMQRRTRRCFRT